MPPCWTTSICPSPATARTDAIGNMPCSEVAETLELAKVAHTTNSRTVAAPIVTSPLETAKRLLPSSVAAAVSSSTCALFRDHPYRCVADVLSVTVQRSSAAAQPPSAAPLPVRHLDPAETRSPQPERDRGRGARMMDASVSAYYEGGSGDETTVARTALRGDRSGSAPMSSGTSAVSAQVSNCSGPGSGPRSWWRRPHCTRSRIRRARRRPRAARRGRARCSCCRLDRPSRSSRSRPQPTGPGGSRCTRCGIVPSPGNSRRARRVRVRPRSC